MIHLLDGLISRLLKDTVQTSLNYIDYPSQGLLGCYAVLCCIKRIVFLDFIHRLVSQEQTKLKIIIDKR